MPVAVVSGALILMTCIPGGVPVGVKESLRIANAICVSLAPLDHDSLTLLLRAEIGFQNVRSSNIYIRTSRNF